MARALWKGSIAFGLVQIPVSLQGAEEHDELSFDLLDARDFAPIGYERVNKKTGKKVDWEHIVKGYEHAKGRYVVVRDADFEAANVEASHTIDIDRFVDLAAVDPLYFERPYYVEPAKSGRKAYALLRDTLARTAKAGIAKVVIRTRQHLALLLPRGDVLVLLLLRFAHELRKPDGLDLPKDNKALGITAQERAMANTLVESMQGEFDPKKYRDEFRDDLLALIEERAKRGELNALPEEAPKKRPKQSNGKVIDLMQLLQQSVQQSSAAPRSSSKKKKPAASKRARGERQLRKSA